MSCSIAQSHVDSNTTPITDGLLQSEVDLSWLKSIWWKWVLKQLSDEFSVWWMNDEWWMTMEKLKVLVRPAKKRVWQKKYNNL